MKQTEAAFPLPPTSRPLLPTYDLSHLCDVAFYCYILPKWGQYSVGGIPLGPLGALGHILWTLNTATHSLAQVRAAFTFVELLELKLCIGHLWSAILFIHDTNARGCLLYLDTTYIRKHFNRTGAHFIAANQFTGAILSSWPRQDCPVYCERLLPPPRSNENRKQTPGVLVITHTTYPTHTLRQCSDAL